MASQFDEESEAGETLLRRLQATPYQPPQPEDEAKKRQRIAALLKQRGQ